MLARYNYVSVHVHELCFIYTLQLYVLSLPSPPLPLPLHTRGMSDGLLYGILWEVGDQHGVHDNTLLLEGKQR